MRKHEQLICGSSRIPHALLGDTIGRPDEAEKIAEGLAAGAPDELRDDDILMLEITAESPRNPAVAEIVKLADARLRARSVATFERDHPKLSAVTVAARLELPAVLYEGTLLRRMTVRTGEIKRLRNVYLAMVERLLSQDDWLDVKKV